MHRLLISAITGAAATVFLCWALFSVSLSAAVFIFALEVSGIIFGWVVRGYAEAGH